MFVNVVENTCHASNTPSRRRNKPYWSTGWWDEQHISNLVYYRPEFESAQNLHFKYLHMKKIKIVEADILLTYK